MAHIIFLLGSATETKGDRDGKGPSAVWNGPRMSTWGTDSRHSMERESVMAAFPASWSPDMVAGVQLELGKIMGFHRHYYPSSDQRSILESYWEEQWRNDSGNLRGGSSTWRKQQQRAMEWGLLVCAGRSESLCHSWKMQNFERQLMLSKFRKSL